MYAATVLVATVLVVSLHWPAVLDHVMSCRIQALLLESCQLRQQNAHSTGGGCPLDSAFTNLALVHHHPSYVRRATWSDSLTDNPL